ncbi:MAG: periplasmic heavy metal sensor [Nitrospirota bacterium]|nr:periplasmic heavy metal sensor [Nitrospirota bacterium]
MKKSVLFFTVIFIFLAGFTIDSHAHVRGKGRGWGMPACSTMQGMGPCMCGGCMAMSGERPMMGMGMRMMISNLGLDEKQAAEFRAIHLTMKKERIQKNAEIRIAELELRELLDKDPVDTKVAEAKVKQTESLRSELKMLHIRTHEKVKAMLTPEQRKKLESFKGMGYGMRHGMGRGMGMMGNCLMMGNPGGMGQSDQMNPADEGEMQGDEDIDDAELPAESRAD